MCNDGWINISSERVYDANIFTLYKDRTKCLRTDVEADFYRFDTVDWVNVLAVTKDGEMVVIEQFRHGAQDVKLEIPGGCIDPEDVDPVAAGVRELLEETGYAGDPGILIGRVQPNPALQGNYCYTVLVENAYKASEPRMEDLEDIDTVLMSEEELNQAVLSGELDHGLVLNALYFYELHRKGKL